MINFFSANSQESTLDRVIKQSKEIDSLRKRVVNLEIDNKRLSTLINNKDKENKKLSTQVTKLNSCKPLKITHDSLLVKYKELEKSNRTLESNYQDDLKTYKTKAQIYSKISTNYKTQDFEYLISNFSKESVARDSNLLIQDKEIQKRFNELKFYFEAKELLSNPYDANKIQIAQNKLNSIDQTSEKLDNLKQLLEDYKVNYHGLKDCLENISKIDSKVSEMPEDVRRDKIKDIIYELSTYIFDYDINFNDYPYISKVLNRIIIDKYGNPDKNISKLLK